jgi:hypothetical protein
LFHFTTRRLAAEQYPMIQPFVVFPMPNRLMRYPFDNSSRHKFLKTEDDWLRELVGRHGEKNWTLIASQMKRRTARQCRERYKNYLSPAVDNRPWSVEEESLLIDKVSELGQKWTQIAAFFERRSDVHVKNHWAMLTLRSHRIQKYESAKEQREQKVGGFIEPAFPIEPAIEDQWPWPSSAFAPTPNGDGFEQ